MKKQISFVVWIDRFGGPSALAHRLGISRQRVNGWLCGNCLPRARVMKKLFQISKGQVTLDMLLRSYQRGKE